MKHKDLVILLVMIGVVVLSFMVLRSESKPVSINTKYTTLKDNSINQIKVGDNTLSVEVVNTPQSITLGLSGREAIRADGMLFVFQEKKPVAFWMKEMKFDLDMIWIANGKVLGFVENVPKPLPETPLEQLPLYRPHTDVEMVLELPAGKVKELSIQEDDTVQLL